MRICHLIYDDIANPWLAGGGAVRVREIYRRLAAQHQIKEMAVVIQMVNVDFFTIYSHFDD